MTFDRSQSRTERAHRETFIYNRAQSEIQVLKMAAKKKAKKKGKKKR
jgi:hypothetical protein